MLELDLRPDRRKLRSFGLAALVFLGLLGTLARWRGGLPGLPLGGATEAVSLVLWTVAAFSGLMALAFPPANRPLYVLLTVIAWPVGQAVSLALLLALYFLVFVPMGLAFRLAGRDPLQRRWDPQAGSYWTPHRRSGGTERYFKQF